MTSPAPKPTLCEEKSAWAQGYRAIVGIDEAGRGCLAGPVIAAAVILPYDWVPTGLADSKTLPESQRETLYSELIVRARAYAIGSATAEEIDSINILKATHLAMRRALQNLPVGFHPDLALIDGLPVRPFPIEQIAIVNGDALCVSISAASILAKVTRDRLMRDYAREFPAYGFENHKGYGAPKHLHALQTEGACAIHRRTFRPVREAIAAREKTAE